MGEGQAYRAMDLLVEADEQDQVQEAVFFGGADLLNLEVDLLLCDTTSTPSARSTSVVLRRSKDSLRAGGWTIVSELPYPDNEADYRTNPDQRRLAGRAGTRSHRRVRHDHRLS
jgi:hypothetical protein